MFPPQKHYGYNYYNNLKKTSANDKNITFTFFMLHKSNVLRFNFNIKIERAFNWVK